MATQHVLYNEDAQAKLVEGVNVLANAVKVSMGPRGRTVVIKSAEHTPLKTTKDGVTIAKTIEVKDADVNTGIQLVRSATQKAVEITADGTTAAAVLAQSLIEQGRRYVGKGVNVAALRSGMEKARDEVVRQLKAMSAPVDSFETKKQIATVSANGDSVLGQVVAEAFDKVGTDGVVKVDDSKAIDGATLDYFKGLRFKKGWLSEQFCDEGSAEVKFSNPVVLVSTQKILSLHPLGKVLEFVAQKGLPLVIIADDIDTAALNVLVLNQLRSSRMFRVCAIKAPGYGENRKAMLGDIACYTGATLIDESVGIRLEDATPEYLGTCETFTASARETTIFNNVASEELKTRIEGLRKIIEETESSYDRDKAQERLANLTTGIATIRAGGISEEERGERKDRLDDAVGAVRSALQEGFVPGGGNALLHISKKMKQAGALDSLNLSEDELFGAKILVESIQAPFKTILENAGIEWGLLYNDVADTPEIGYDASKLEITDLVARGIIDPTKVIRSSLECAVSVAVLVLTAGATIVYDFEEPKITTMGIPAIGM